MKKNKINIFIILICFFIGSCTTVKEAFDPNTNSGDEFLVEKKSPLIMPPNYDELPSPDSTEEKNKEEKTEIEMLITNTKKDSDKENKPQLSTSFEEFIIGKILKK